MADKDDGGPAFPFVTPQTDVAHVTLGMSLRDWFAGQALAGIMSTVDEYIDDKIPKIAYDFADAMLEEKERRSR